MQIDWSIVAGAAGFAGARVLLGEYGDWKCRRKSIPLDLNPRTGVYEADFKLKRWEKWARIAAWAWAGAICVIGYNVVVNDWFN